VQIWVHLVWRTKDSERLFFNENAVEIRNHIIDYAKQEKISLEAIQIQPEHVHALINLPSNVLLKDVIKKLKGESSHFVNSENLLNKSFSWARGYGGFSLGASQLETVKKYIENQKEHHRVKSFNEEWSILLQKYGLEENR
jgi:REP element-mobilizing transposase RayT